MSFWSSFFGEKRTASGLLFDIGERSVAAGYALYAEDARPTLLYARRLPVMPRPGEEALHATTRALGALGEELIREGAPALLRATGSGASSFTLVSFGAPWQQVSHHAAERSERSPFVFSPETAREMLSAGQSRSPGFVPVDLAVIDVSLNGYPSRAPYGAPATRAAVSALRSSVEREALAAGENALASLLLTRGFRRVARASSDYQALRAAFAHEKDLLLIDVEASHTHLYVVRQGMLARMENFAVPFARQQEWRETHRRTCAALAERVLLPHTLCVLASEEGGAQIRDAFAEPALRALWDARAPLRILPITPGHVSALVSSATETPDLSLMLMALYAEARARAEP